MASLPRYVTLPAILAATVVVVVALFDDGARPAADTIARVAAHPERYDGRDVALTGVVVAIPVRVPPAHEGAFVMGGEPGGRLLVVPPSAADTQASRVGSVVRVRGVVRAPEAYVEERRPENPPVTGADLLSLTGADAVIEASVVREAASPA